MKIAFLLVILCIVSMSYDMRKDKEKEKISIIFFRGFYESPVFLSYEDFWKKENLDTIEITSRNLIGTFSGRIEKLEPKEVMGIDTRFAFVIRKKKCCDTIYADRFLNLWENRKGGFEDKSGFFKKYFSQLINID